MFDRHGVPGACRRTGCFQPFSGPIGKAAGRVVRSVEPDESLPDTISDVANAVRVDAPLLAALGQPIAATWPMRGRTSDVLKRELQKNPNSARARLESYVVLTYADATSANLARERLKADSRVLSVGANLRLSYAAAAPDPYFAANPNAPYHGNYQRRMQLLNLPGAWDVSNGTAYVGVVDHGIYCSDTTGGICTAHPDLRANFRPQFSRNMNGGIVDELQGAIGDRAGHGTHVAGIIAAAANNATGVAGACQSCSLAIVKIESTLSASALYAAIVVAVDTGAQVLNFSLSDDIGADSFFDPSISCYSGANVSNGFSVLCDAVAYAKFADVAFVAASGNDYNFKGRLGFPAIDDKTIAVGGVKVGGYFWDDGDLGSCTPANPQGGSQCGSNWGNQQDITTMAAGPTQLVAPAKNVISTFYDDKDWSVAVYCSDTWGQTGSNGNPVSGVLASGYGDCRGTSMAAPHVSGIAGLIQSANPLLTSDQVKSILLDSRNTVPCVGSDTKCGAGMADAARAVRAALGAPAAINRLAPLFSFYSAERYDHFYAVVPQMGTAAILGQLLPYSYTGSTTAYSSIGPTTSALSWFPGIPTSICGFSPPCVGYYPRAMVSVFTTFRNPDPLGVPLVPLYRLSWTCPNGSDPSCTNPEHVSHAYSTDPTESWGQTGCRVDGIEGYVYPRTMAQPAGTVKLCRKYYPGADPDVHDDFILFPGGGTNGTDCSAPTDGYTPGGNNYTDGVYGIDWIGWVYTARAPQAVYAPPISNLTNRDD